jgi:hypothetical protein
MKIVKLQNFDQFIRVHRDVVLTEKPNFPPRPIVFRGYSKESHKLIATLERYTSRSQHSFRDYIQVMVDAYPEFSSYTRHVFDDNFIAWRDKPTWAGISNSIGLMGFMIHLRHVGFPSPLLDWTASPYVAAYFAYSRAYKEDVAIYALMEPDVQTYDPTEPHIQTAGRYQRTSERHHIQQAQYSVCMFERDDVEYFASHEAISGENVQNVIVKFVIPSPEKVQVLDLLSSMNINQYTLFRSEEGLADLLAHKNLRFKGWQDPPPPQG